ncbi:MAG: LysR substrate-binding domain-containing protein [Magnetospiraceae bacterium]
MRLIHEVLFDDALAVVGRSGHPLSDLESVRLGDLAAYSWVVPRRSTPTREAFEQMFRARKKPASIVESSSLILIRGLLLASDQLTLISSRLVQFEISHGFLSELPVSVSVPTRSIGLTWRDGWRPTAAQAHFMACLREAAEQANQVFPRQVGYRSRYLI